MILGLGADLVDIRRIERSLERFGERFIDRIFTEEEQAWAERRARSQQGRASSYAKRFAAKEAGVKALGTGFSQGLFWRDLAVVNLPGGQPTLRLSGAALLRLQTLLPPGMAARIDLTMTDEYPMAEAVVILSALPAG